MIVVDASVAVKWLFPEPGEGAAQCLLTGGDSLLGPALIRVEVAAAIARKARAGEIGAQDAETAAELWLQAIADGVVELVPDEADLSRAFRLALALNHPLQDCLYLALAERLGAPLVTADERFVMKAGPSHPGIRLLA
jgi:predicted nucleic acid-binding protein